MVMGVSVAPPAVASAPVSAAAGAPTTAVASTAMQPPIARESIRRTADLSKFRAGNIISDEVFFNSSTMTQSQISAFFNGKVSTCRSGYTCLKDFKQNTPNRQADAYCSGYSGAANESAATIIYKSAIACGINPQVLIVMLEKEQSLVTHTWPSQWRYDMALGQGCPDTAPCDPAFSGFFYQIYGAARQMKIYAEGKYFTWYAPGKTWNILYNPNTACGSSPVYIENTATAALYYYTPYQPNAAALRAGYGTGDNCSAYGNRNFYNLFNDWFGSTHVSESHGALIQAQGDSRVFLTVGADRYHVSTPRDLAAFSSRLGAVETVSTTYRDKFTARGSITRYVHDPRTGTLYLLESDGSKHRFPSVESVTGFGYGFDTFKNLPGEMLDPFTTGGDVGNVFRSENSPEVYFLEGQTKRYIPTPKALDAAYGSGSKYIASMDAAAASKLPEGPLYVIAGMLLKIGGENSPLFMASSGKSLIIAPNAGLAAAYGPTETHLVLGAAALGFTVLKEPLSLLLRCGETDYLASAGKLTPLSGSTATMLTAPKLTTAECAGFAKRAEVLPVPVFLLSPAGNVYHMAGNKVQYVTTPAQLDQLSQGTLRLIPTTEAALSGLAHTPAAIPAGTAIQFSGKGEVYQWDGQQLHHIVAFSTLLALYGGQVPPIAKLPEVTLPGYPKGAPL